MDKLIVFDPASHSHLIPSLVSIHIAYITTPPYTNLTFKPPLDTSRMQSWWEDRVQEDVAGNRDIIIQLASNSASGEEELAGIVSLSIPFSETGPFRGGVEKLLVSPEHRRKGIARALMLKLEEVSREK
jgi:GNAT superfamily N-acetyltransferase